MSPFRTTAIMLCALGATLLSAYLSTSGASEVETALRGLRPASAVASCRVVGGTCTTQQEWPWQTALFLRKSNATNVFTCGGSLIAPNWVLSAAHCFGQETSSNSADWTVVDDVTTFTPLKLPPGATVRKVKRILVH